MARMISWSEYVYYSLDFDCEVARLIGFDEHHQGHWLVIETGRGYRDRRDEAILKIQESIEAQDPPGELPEEKYEGYE